MGTYAMLRKNSREYIQNNPDDPARYDHIQVKGKCDTSLMPDFFIGDRLPDGFEDGVTIEEENHYTSTYEVMHGILVDVKIEETYAGHSDKQSGNTSTNQASN